MSEGRRLVDFHSYLLFGQVLDNGLLLLLLFNTTRITSGPPSAGAAIAMDGGMADTACYYTGR
jgi:hypothetical protein